MLRIFEVVFVGCVRNLGGCPEHTVPVRYSLAMGNFVLRICGNAKMILLFALKEVAPREIRRHTDKPILSAVNRLLP